MIILLCLREYISPSWYRLSMALSKLIAQIFNRSVHFLELGSASFSACIILKQSKGVTVLETKNEAKRATVIVITRGWIKSLATPVKKITGRNTITVVKVEIKIGAATSKAASRVACILGTFSPAIVP